MKEKAKVDGIKDRKETKVRQWERGKGEWNRQQEGNEIEIEI